MNVILKRTILSYHATKVVVFWRRGSQIGAGRGVWVVQDNNYLSKILLLHLFASIQSRSLLNLQDYK